MAGDDRVAGGDGRWGRWVPAAIVCFAFAVRLAFLTDVRALGFFDSPISDAHVYVERARGIVAGDWRGPADFVHAPLYAYLVAAVMWPAGPEPWWALRLVQAALGAAACGLAVGAGRWWVGARAGPAAGLLLAVCPAAIFFDGLIQKTSLEIFLTAALLWWMAAYGRSGGAARSVAIGVVLGLLTLTRQHALAVVPLVAVWLAVTARATGQARPGRGGRAGAVAVIGCVAAWALVVSPWVVRNRLVLGSWALSTPNLGQNFWMGNSGEASGTYVALRRGAGSGETEQRAWVRAAERAAGRSLNAAEVSDHYLRLGLDWVRAHPGEWLRLQWKKWLATWNAYEAYDAEDYYLYRERSRVLRALDAAMHFGALAPLGILGAVWAAPHWRRVWFLWAWLALNALAVAVFVVFARYRAVMLPVLCLTAAAGAVGLWDEFRRWRGQRSTSRAEVSRRGAPSGAGRAMPAGVIRPDGERPDRGTRIAAVACGALAAVACNLRVLHARHTQAQSYVNHAAALSETGRYAEALAEAERALQRSPGDVEALVCAGDVLERQGRFEDALARYEAALAGDASYVRALTGRANALMGLGRLREAEATCTAALTIEPADRVARRGLATAVARQGRLADSLVLFERLAADEPDYAEGHLNMGNALLGLGRIDEAAAAFERAARLRPAWADAWHNLGVAEALRGRHEPAESAFEQAMRLDPRREDSRAALEASRSRKGPP